MEYTIKHDCFAFREKEKKDTHEIVQECDALNALYCEKEKCRFYKKKGTV